MNECIGEWTGEQFSLGCAGWIWTQLPQSMSGENQTNYRLSYSRFSLVNLRSELRSVNLSMKTDSSDNIIEFHVFCVLLHPDQICSIYQQEQLSNCWHSQFIPQSEKQVDTFPQNIHKTIFYSAHGSQAIACSSPLDYLSLSPTPVCLHKFDPKTAQHSRA